jgi:hypothetical protein
MKRRDNKEWMMLAFLLRPYRCIDCNLRYFGPVFQRPLRAAEKADRKEGRPPTSAERR